LFGQPANKSSTLTRVYKTPRVVARIAAKTASSKKAIAKCILLSAKNAAKKDKFLSNHATRTMCFALSVSKNQRLNPIQNQPSQIQLN